MYCFIAVKWIKFKDVHDEFCGMDTPCIPIRFIIIQCLVMRCGKPLHPSVSTKVKLGFNNANLAILFLANAIVSGLTTLKMNLLE